ncbi:phosphatidate cytidylyltransferase [candidate division WOR-3 bacterium]|nr:phosphatidate cytidylyltransferase [candidate division WOR-3 bacterium]
MSRNFTTRKNVIARIAVAVFFIPLIIFFIIKGGLFFFIPLLITAVVSSTEAYNISQKALGIEKGAESKMRYVFVISGICFLLSNTYFSGIHPLLISAFVFFLFFVEIVTEKPENFAKRISSVVYATVYVSWGFSSLSLLRRAGEGMYLGDQLGIYLVCLAFTVAWLSDTFGFTFGYLLGKRPLIPSISPKKTIEGSIGGIAGAISGAVLIKAIQIYLCPALHLPWIFILFSGLLGGIASQLGDLVESMMKRDAKIEQSSGILPGHGGILDRFDSVFFSSFVILLLNNFLMS